ncbi:CPBP family intramembrane glutamic endopeptidase [Anaerocolumna sp. MB42-C2]|uniref:CPBP family intramembrane glutamic endopeptidase n=1 Tax=Anaerocolumna sp. MB42-C2 TaxID=3070997 RepID=UPI0027DF2776|nr:CPBP family intramembrane glutamic endopeptidase [Anaerocolumna sp. MB42-C2]WMJ89083.1 CPBP family intramembrane glutamic endopeptidase [Anaerocolumna sp. MB42-C2]
MNKVEGKVFRNILGIVFIIFLVYSALFLTILLAQLLSMAFTNINSNKWGFTILTWISMGTGFIIYPILITKAKYSVKMEEIGFGKISKIEKIFILIGSILGIIFILKERTISIEVLLGVVIQNLAVACSEETFARGILFYYTKRLVNSSILKILVSGIVFAFIFHSSDPLLLNLTYRLPMGLILAFVYSRTNNLSIPVFLHLVNNILASQLVK